MLTQIAADILVTGMCLASLRATYVFLREFQAQRYRR